MIDIWAYMCYTYLIVTQNKDKSVSLYESKKTKRRKGFYKQIRSLARCRAECRTGQRAQGGGAYQQDKKR